MFPYKARNGASDYKMEILFIFLRSHDIVMGLLSPRMMDLEATEQHLIPQSKSQLIIIPS